MKRLFAIALSVIMLSGCSVLDYLVEQDKLVHPDPILAGPDMNGAARCDETCQAELDAYIKKHENDSLYRAPQSYDTHEYQVQINGKTVTCRPGLNTGSMDGINHNVICE